MKIVLTGASSFTGSWFARLLIRQGHQILAPLRASLSQYEGVRGKRLAWLSTEGVQWVERCAFGDERFISLLQNGADLLCHHGATVENYKSMDFDVGAALTANTRSLPEVLRAAREGGVKAVVLTGSVFEPEEGAGNEPLRAFSPYGLSKGLTWQVFSYWCEINAVPLHKFVIPNPFGPWEEPRFCAYLMRCWIQGQVAQVNTPDYVRDNIHVDLLAMAYAQFVELVAQGHAPGRLGPSGYVETQGAFATRFAAEIGSRLAMATPLQLNTQTDFSEPFSRINTDRIALPWLEAQAWDQLAAYYRETYLDSAA